MDALVIGAGPAGLMAAEELARAGRRVLALHEGVLTNDAPPTRLGPGTRVFTPVAGG